MAALFTYVRWAVAINAYANSNMIAMNRVIMTEVLLVKHSRFRCKDRKLFSDNAKKKEKRMFQK